MVHYRLHARATLSAVALLQRSLNLRMKLNEGEVIKRGLLRRICQRFTHQANLRWQALQCRREHQASRIWSTHYQSRTNFQLGKAW